MWTTFLDYVLNRDRNPPAVNDFVKGMQVLSVRPGDALLIDVDRPLTADQVTHIRAMVEAALPGVKPIFIYPGMSINGVVEYSPMQTRVKA